LFLITTGSAYVTGVVGNFVYLSVTQRT